MGGQFRNRRNADPATRLDRSHEQIRERLQTLVAAAKEFDGTSAPASRNEILEVLSFFQSSVSRHERDEEDSILPRLSAHPALRPVVDQLRADHRIFEKSLARLEKQAKENPPKAPLSPMCREIQRSYLDHIRREDRQLLPALRRHIDAAEQAKIVDEMLERRGHL